MLDKNNFFFLICARGGSKGLPGKNVKLLNGLPLIAHTIRFAIRTGLGDRVVVSTDSPEIADVAVKFGAEVPFVRPAHLATDDVAKMPVLVHALESCERSFGKHYDFLVDLDPTSPIRQLRDLSLGLDTFLRRDCDTCFSVVRARKNPYFNMVELDERGGAVLCKRLSSPFASRQASPNVWEMNASIYIYRSSFLRSNPKSLWDGTCCFFEMDRSSAFDIDHESDFLITEQLMKNKAVNG